VTKEELAEQEQAKRFLAAPAPGGSQVLSIARFRRHTLRSMGGELLDQVLADETTGGRYVPPGLQLSWMSPEGQVLRTHVAHPAGSELLDELLPLAVAAALRVGARVQLVARHEALLAQPKVVDVLSTPSAPRAVSGGYREAPPLPEQALGALTEAGFALTARDPRALVLTRRRMQRKQPAWLLMLVPVLFFGPVLAVLARSIRQVWELVRSVLIKALRDQQEQLTWEVREGVLTVRAESQPGQRLAVSVPLREVLATSFAPAGVHVTDQDVGCLRAITHGEAVTLAHGFAAPDARKDSPSARAEQARATGHTLRTLLEWLVVAHRPE
jgi:hypothetical protein